MHTPVTLSFEARFGTIAGLQWGTGNPHKVLALHGWLDNAASFWHLAPLLANQGIELTAIDLPGHGHSDHRAPGHNYGFIDYVMDVQAVMDQMDQPVGMICHSMGAAIAAMYAAAYPEQVRYLVMLENLGPVPPFLPGKAASSLREALDLWRKHSLEHKRFYDTVEQAIKARQEATPMPADIIRPLVERSLNKTKQGLHWRSDKRLRLRSFFRMTEEQIQEFLGATVKPTQLIIAKPKSYALQYPSVSDRLQALQPADYVELDGDHHLHMTQAKPVAETIMKFISSIETRQTDES